MDKKPNVIDLFCGCGGFSIGFKKYFNILAGIENFKPSAKTYMHNINAKIWVDDIKRIPPMAFDEFINKERVDVIIGSPPCEPFTKANIKIKDNPLDRLYKDKIGQLVLYYINYVDYFTKKNDDLIFVMENVPQIKEIKDELKKLFGDIGHKVYFNILRAEDYGNPSKRARMFISNIKLKPKKQEKKVVVDAIGGIDENTPNHEIQKLSPKKLALISKLKWGESLYKFEGKNKVMENWFRLHPYKLAPTVKGKGRFVHPYEDRLLTVREHARLMGFDDDFVFFGGRNTQYNMIGESVPPTLSEAIAEVVKNIIIK
ncbi:DNA cytosine methyltransferase [Methanotorris formicicus]|uniref:DNA (cytosine-5-)-methyltransferase n=1 Tax=Methanotorris formicicus Mc-S-70 TaxID=647171 RepID=H1KXB0_9EURY|nr:DNA cytosine methyltransferase [Methanotorris formicicus]EHP88322.1 DNA-cytosine methyltransferase [Methanotorris formicicus Mc-S-70]